MLQPIKNRVKFQLELLVLRGPHYRLLVVALLIALIAVAAGVLVFLVGAAFTTVGAAIWWAFLRLTDPGYLGDDQGTLLRTVSTVVTVLGYVVFLGALVAIMTQWFQQTMNRLQAGLTPIAQRQHVLVLGWTSRTATIVEELFYSEGRVRRFLERFGARRLRVVLLSDEDPGVVAQELHDHLGRLWEPTRFILRSGTPLRLEHLERVDFLNASVILIPASDVVSPLEVTVDGDVVKTLITIADAAAENGVPPPLVVAEIMDARKVPLARRAYDGPVEVIASDELLSRMIAQNLRHERLSYVYSELLGQEWGNEIYLRSCPSIVGARFCDAMDAFSTAIPIGVVRDRGDQLVPLLNPPHDLAIEDGDRVVLVAEDYEHAAADRKPRATEPRARDADAAASVPVSHRRILILGWNHKTASLIGEIDRYDRETAEIDIVSRVPGAERNEFMDRLDVRPKRARWKQIEADYTSPSDLARFKPAGYDSVVLMASDYAETNESSDARTILGYLVLDELLDGEPRRPHILTELLHPDNVSLFRHRPGEVVVSPVLISHVLSQVALRRELHVVFDVLFGSEGAEISFVPASELVGDAAEVRFAAVQRECMARGQIALGMRLAKNGDVPGGVLLNPPRDRSYALSAGDGVVVLES